MSYIDNTTPEVKHEIMQRDKLCVYCGKKMIYPYRRDKGNNSATLEHFKEGTLNREKPFTKDEVAMCCGSCNSSRRQKKLSDWFKKAYCRGQNSENKIINEDTVAQIVKEYIKRNPEY